jgi:hypothetical protein
MRDAQQAKALERLIQEDAVGQLRRREGRMAILGSEDGIPKLDWVEGIARLLADKQLLEAVEAEARDIWQRGIRHVIWAGMGGSVMAVRVLTELGFCGRDKSGPYGRDKSGPYNGEDHDQITIYPLDSTDPAALNAIVRRVAQAKNLALPTPESPVDAAWLRALLSDVMMIGVSMGMTSEEPITHLEWFTDLLAQAEMLPSEHLLVMTLPGSYLDKFAHEHAVPSRSLQPDGGTGTGGRMSAPTTRVFLLPAALYLTSRFDQPGQLRTMLQQAWGWYDLDEATRKPAEHPFVQLAAALSEASMDGICRLLLEMLPTWMPMLQWIEQLMEESLGKGGKGVVVFPEQPLDPSRPGYTTNGTLHVQVTQSSRGGGSAPPDTESSMPIAEERLPTGGAEPPPLLSTERYILHQPYLANQEPIERLAALAASFLGWQLTMALYGYLQDIIFAGQPAVENYKTRARTLRQQGDPLAAIARDAHHGMVGAGVDAVVWWGPLWSSVRPQNMEAGRGPLWSSIRPQNMAMGQKPLWSSARPDDLFKLFEQQLATTMHGRPAYLDITINAEISPAVLSLFARQGQWISDNLLGVPVKLRRAPAAYHSTEQSEMDGPPGLLSLRYLARHHEACLIGSYDDTFLCAQAVSTWQAMLEQGRMCFLLVIDGSIEQIAAEQFIAPDAIS